VRRALLAGVGLVAVAAAGCGSDASSDPAPDPAPSAGPAYAVAGATFCDDLATAAGASYALQADGEPRLSGDEESSSAACTWTSTALPGLTVGLEALRDAPEQTTGTYEHRTEDADAPCALGLSDAPSVTQPAGGWWDQARRCEDQRDFGQGVAQLEDQTVAADAGLFVYVQVVGAPEPGDLDAVGQSARELSDALLAAVPDALGTTG
jgi:hypothetical protein